MAPLALKTFCEMGIEPEYCIEKWHQGSLFTGRIDFVDAKTGNEVLTICCINPCVTIDTMLNFDANAVPKQHFTVACHG